MNKLCCAALARGLMLFFIYFLLCQTVLAEEIYLKDVPEGHYAYDAVYDLVQRGVTGGYPDGTYRGKKNISRFEIAAFISKFARSFDNQQSETEKIVEELKTELAESQYEVDKEKASQQVSGNLTGRLRYGQTTTQKGGLADYRLIIKTTKKFGETGSLVVNFDTMDAGYAGGSRDLATELLDFEGNLKFGLAALKFTVGPGDVNHVDSGLFPAENNIKYRRPKRTAGISFSLGKTELSATYLVRSSSPTGFISTAEVSLKLSCNLAPIKVTLNPRLFSNVYGSHDSVIEVLGEIKPSDVFNLSLLAGLSKSTNFPHGVYVKGELTVADKLKLFAQKIGSQYREVISYNIFDSYDRNLTDGALNYGASLFWPIYSAGYLKAKADYLNPGEIITGELAGGLMISDQSLVEIYCQSYRNQTNSSQIGAKYSYQI